MKRAALLLGLTALVACSLDPHYERPGPAVPPSWPRGDAYLRASEATLPAVSYRDIFRDPKLQTIIKQALANNQDLQVALGNVAAARGQYRVQRAQQLPQIGGRAGLTTGRRSSTGNTSLSGIDTGGTGTGGTGTGTGIGNGAGTGAGTGIGTTSTNGRVTTSYDANIGLSAFEVDLFGRLRSLSRAALQEYLATEAGVRATRLSLVGEVASAYLAYATDNSLLAIAVDTEKSARKTYELTDARLKGGIAPRTDVRQAETILAQARSDHAAQVTLVAQDRNALELLVGAPVDDALLPKVIEDVDKQLGELPAGLDSRILLRRPDVVQAEYVLKAANARIGAARANFFPTISLTALAGLASTALTGLFTGGAFTWSVAPSVSVPIFDGGANRGNLLYAQAQRDIAVAQYKQTVQTAFREVADALARRGTIDAQVAAQEELEAAAADTNLLETARYREGIDPFLNTLDTQRTLYTARRALVQTRLLRAENLVTLYRVLGGDQLISDPPPAKLAEQS